MRPNRTTDKGIQLLLILIISFNILPHASQVPIWVDLLAVTMLGWKALYLTRGVKIPPQWLLWTISGLSAAGVIAEYGTVWGPEAASAILVCLASSKLLETNRYRDAMFIIFTSYFLLMAYVLNAQSLLATIYMASDVLFITMLMFHIHRRDRRNSARSLRPAMRLLGLSLPVWIFLFVIFPRFSTGLLGQGARPSMSTGFDDALNPGSIESLVQSEDVMFRVAFADHPPSPDNLYWRGSVLSLGEGLSWKTGMFHPAKPVAEQPEGRIMSYDVWAEPGIRRWLFLLDRPTSVRTDESLGRLLAHKTSDSIYRLNIDLPERAHFSATSVNKPPIESLSTPERIENLNLPMNLDPRISAIAQSWVQEWNQRGLKFSTHTRESFLISRALQWFARENFRYTKSPGAMDGNNPTEQLASFLFERKLGFCEHYAAAFATFMRSAGVPAHVTVGFQGGKLNDFGNYMLVRSLDAHAWTEIWVEDPQRTGLGYWKRVDPTATVAPLRIQLGGEFNKSENESLVDDTDKFRRELVSQLQLFTARFSLAWDAAQMRWNAFLLGYDFDFQKSLMSQLGWKEASRWIFAGLVLIGCSAFVIILALWLRRPARRSDPILLSWRLLCAKLEKAGLPRHTTEGPLQYAARVASLRPDLAQPIQEIAKSYASLRYGPPDSHLKKLQNEFTQAVQRFNAKLTEKHLATSAK